MSMTDIHVGDVGTVFEVTVMEDAAVAVDVSGATLKQIIYTKPDGVKLTKTASYKTNGTDGILRYTTVANDLDLAGAWQLQAYVELAAGKWHSSIISFRVEANL